MNYNINQAETIVVWGAQNYFENLIDPFLRKYSIHYVYPDGPVISKKSAAFNHITNEADLLGLAKPFVVIARDSHEDVSRIVKILNKLQIPYDHLNFYTYGRYNIKYLIAMGKYSYEDLNKNRITIGSKVQVHNNAELYVGFGENFHNNEVIIGDIIISESLKVHVVGSGGYVNIKDHTTIRSTLLHCGPKGRVIVGEDCMLSYGIDIMQSDHHHIFDLQTGKRINVTKDIIIGKHVWIGQKATVLNGAQIGNGCILGANSVTSSTFPDNAVIAGNPAKVIRKDIVWTRDLVGPFDFEDYSQALRKPL